MRILAWILGLFVLSIGVITVGGMLSPREIRVERSIQISTPPEAVFPCLTDLEIWQEWEPWGAQDASLKVRFGETRRGLGASYSWSGDKMGQGTLEIIAIDPPTRVDYRLVFNGDEAAPGGSAFILKRIGPSKTAVTWSFESDLGDNPVSRLLGYVLTGAVGKMYEEGLVALKQVAENRLAIGDPAADAN